MTPLSPSPLCVLCFRTAHTLLRGDQSHTPPGHWLQPPPAPKAWCAWAGGTQTAGLRPEPLALGSPQGGLGPLPGCTALRGRGGVWGVAGQSSSQRADARGAATDPAAPGERWPGSLRPARTTGPRDGTPGGEGGREVSPGPQGPSVALRAWAACPRGGCGPRGPARAGRATCSSPFAWVPGPCSRSQLRPPAPQGPRALPTGLGAARDPPSS